MYTKLKKYLKTLCCLAVIVSLIVPYYAANTASDPSAFITKDEFDKALADFNARLTTFEAGINSKIDSQVTSYLDRNGIWSPKEQIILNTTLSSSGVPCFKNGRNAFFGDKWNGNEYQGTKDTVNYNFYLLANKKYENLFLNEKICKVDKAGLIYIVYQLESKSAYPKDKRLNVDSSSGCSSYFDAIQFGKNDAIVNYDMRTSGSKDPTTQNVSTFSELMTSVIMNNVTNMGKFYPAYPMVLNGTTLFFVDRDDTVWVRWYAMTVVGGGDIIVDLQQFGPFLEKVQRPLFKIAKCEVY